MFCMKCGYEMPDDATFCKRCGEVTEPMKKETPPKKDPAPPAKKTKSAKERVSDVLAVVAVVLMILLIVAMVSAGVEWVFEKAGKLFDKESEEATVEEQIVTVEDSSVLTASGAYRLEFMLYEIDQQPTLGGIGSHYTAYAKSDTTTESVLDYQFFYDDDNVIMEAVSTIYCSVKNKTDEEKAELRQRIIDVSQDADIPSCCTVGYEWNDACYVVTHTYTDLHEEENIKAMLDYEGICVDTEADGEEIRLTMDGVEAQLLDDLYRKR